MKTTKYYHSINENVIQCDLCPRHCRLRLDEKGFCFVRENHSGKMVLSAYGYASGLAIDPMEKKPLYHFLPGKRILSLGTAGCNLGCKFCQNWHLSRSEQIRGISTKQEPEEIVALAQSNKIPAIAFTYNDPVVFFEYALDTAKLARAAEMKTVAVTAGYICKDPREDFFYQMDAANVDLKSFREDFYRKYCAAHLQPVLDTLIFIRQKTNTWLEITTLIIPGLNDSEKELRDLSAWIAQNLGKDTPLHFSAFHPANELMNIPATTSASLIQARQWAMEEGLCYVYTGNIHDPEGQSTICPHCGQIVLRRDYYSISKMNLRKDGKVVKCSHCLRDIPVILE